MTKPKKHTKPKIKLKNNKNKLKHKKYLGSLGKDLGNLGRPGEPWANRLGLASWGKPGEDAECVRISLTKLLNHHTEVTGEEFPLGFEEQVTPLDV